MKTAALDLARERQAHEAGARTRATAHERTPQQERQKAAREAERGREAWTPNSRRLARNRVDSSQLSGQLFC